MDKYDELLKRLDRHASDGLVVCIDAAIDAAMKGDSNG